MRPMSPVWYHQLRDVLDGGLGPAPVPLEHRVGPLRTQDDLAFGAAGQLVVVVVEDPNVEVLVVDDPSSVGLVLDALGLPRDQRGLGHPVGARERPDAEPLLERAVDLDGQRRGADEAQARVRLRRPRQRLFGTVDVVGEQVRHRAEGGGDGGADAVHLGPEVRHREAAVDRRPPAVHQWSQHRRDDGVEVEQRERRPHDVLGGATPAHADLSGQGAVVAVAQHAALRRTRRATGVDEGAEVATDGRSANGCRLAGQQLGPGVDGTPAPRRRRRR